MKRLKRIPARAFKLTKEEQAIEDSIDEYVPMDRNSKEYKMIMKALENTRRALRRRAKNAVLHIRINQGDLDDLKILAQRSDVKYQTYISEVLRQHVEALAGPTRLRRF